MIYQILHKIWRWEYLGLCAILALTLTLHFVAIQRPATIVWDEVWYVGDARSIFSGTGEQRPEHPPLAKLFIVAGDYIFHGFSTPERTSGAETIGEIGGDKERDTAIDVTDASKFNIGSTIRIGSEQMDIAGVDSSLSQITVKRGAGGTTISDHPAQQPVYIFEDTAVGWRFFAVIFGELGIVLVYFVCRSLKFSLKACLIATFLFALDDMTFLHSGLALLDVYMVTFILS
jgi:dolichyl-phosphate-mannose--protein O-mannosyl transferase